MSQFLKNMVAAAGPHTNVINPAGAAAHAANESGWGQSALTREANNLFGIKATPSWRGPVVSFPTEEGAMDGKPDIIAKFRVYPTFTHCFEDYADIIRRMYPFAVQGREHPLAFIAGLFLTGPYKWATDLEAFHKVASILERGGLLGSVPAPGKPVALQSSLVKLEGFTSQQRAVLAGGSTLAVGEGVNAALKPTMSGLRVLTISPTGPH